MSQTTIEGVLVTKRSELDEDPSRQCICRRVRLRPSDRNAWGVKVDHKRWTGSDGTLADWIDEQLLPFKYRPGLKVRVTVEVVEE